MDWIKRIFRQPRSVSLSRPARPGLSAEELRHRLSALRQPAVHLRPQDTSSFSQLGGTPRMPGAWQWPEWKGKPLAFLAQLDLAEIAAALPSFLPASGLLYFFYDQDQQSWGFDPSERDAWRVLYWNGSHADLRERELPAALGEHGRYRRKPMAMHRVEVWPDLLRLPAEVPDDESTRELYRQLKEEAFAGAAPHQVLGYPRPVQDDGMELECQLASNGLYVGDPSGYRDPRAKRLKEGAAEWKLLLQLDSDDDAGWMWGDVGTLYFWIRESDARASDFSKSWMVLQCC